MTCRTALCAALLLLSGACGGATHARKALPPAPPPRSSEELTVWREPPPLAPEPDLTPAWDLRRVRLGNGLHVTVVSRPESSTTAVRLWVPGAFDRANGPVVVMGEALRAGTRTRKGDILVNPRLGQAQVTIATGPKGTEFGWHVLPRASRQAVTLLADFVLHPAFDPEEVQIRMQQELAAIERFSGSHAHLAAIARGALPGFDEPDPERDARRLLQLDVKALEQVYRCTMRPEHAELVVVGPVDFDAVSSWARDSFSAWIGPAAPDPGCAEYQAPASSATPTAPAPIQAQIIYGAKFDPRLAIVLQGPAPESADFAAFTLLSQVLENRDRGSAQRLRHIGATYGVHVRVNDQFPGLTLLELQGQIELGSFQSSLRDLIRDIRTLHGTLTAEELDPLRRRMQASYVASLADNDVLAGSMLWELQHGGLPEEAARWPLALKDVDLAQCRAVAARWLTRPNLSLSVTGLSAKLVGKLAPGIRVRELYWTHELSRQAKDAK